MLDTLREPPDVRQAAIAAGELAFRIFGGDYDGRIVRVRAAKCTIGSAADCTLRLTTAGIRPLHCVIFRGEAGATVRRWSSDTQLNGRAFSDALLMAGDRLQIGPVELQVVDDAVLPRTPSQAPGAPSSATPLPMASLAGEIVEQIKRDLHDKEHDPASARQRKRLAVARERVKRLRHELAAAREKSQRLEGDVSRLQQELTRVEQRSAEMAEKLLQWNDTSAASAGIVEQTRRDADEARHALEVEMATISAERSRLEQSFETVRSKLVTREQEVAELRAELAEKLDQQYRDRQAEQAAWQQERMSLLKSLDEKQQLEQRLEAVLGDLRDAVDREKLSASAQRQELEQERQRLEQKAAELAQLKTWCLEVEDKAQQAARDEALAQNEALRYRERVEELERELLSRAEGNPGDSTAELVQLQTQLAEARRAQLDAASQLERLRKECDEATQARTRAEMTREELKNELDALQAEHAAQNAANDASENDPDVDSQQVARLQAELEQAAEQLTALREQLDQEQGKVVSREEQWNRREQELLRQVTCLENLARNLESDLRTAAEAGEPEPSASNDSSADVEALASQLEAAQQSLTEARSKIAERDSLLGQLRDEVREQMALWQKERGRFEHELQLAREQLAQRLSPESEAAAGIEEAIESPHCEAAEPSDESREAVEIQHDECDAPSYESAGDEDDRYADRSLQTPYADAPAESAADDEEECREPEPEREAPVSVSDVLARLHASGVLPLGETLESEEPSEEAIEVERDEAREEIAEANDQESAVAVATFDDVASSGDGSVEEAMPLVSEVPEWSAPASEAASDPFSPTPARAAESGAPAAEEEDSIEAYMARLLQRVRGDSVANSFMAQQAAQDPRQSQPPPVPEPSPALVAGEAPATEVPREIVRRAAAPEQQVDLVAMRELAIHSARQAITQSTARRRRQAAIATVLIAISSVATGGFLFAWGWHTGNLLAYAGGAVSVGAGILWAIGRARHAPRSRPQAHGPRIVR
jgi:predicted  nucleic acid-binding Zn-ribbon protein